MSHGMHFVLLYFQRFPMMLGNSTRPQRDHTQHAASKVVPPRLIERDYLFRVLSAQEDHLGTGLPSGPIPMAAPSI
jgi:hypothetical protein